MNTLFVVGDLFSILNSELHKIALLFYVHVIYIFECIAFTAACWLLIWLWVEWQRREGSFLGSGFISIDTGGKHWYCVNELVQYTTFSIGMIVVLIIA